MSLRSAVAEPDAAAAAAALPDTVEDDRRHAYVNVILATVPVFALVVASARFSIVTAWLHCWA